MLAWYDSNNDPLDPVTLSGTLGTPGTAVVTRLINNLGGTGAQTESDVVVRVLGRDAATDPWVSDGLPVLDRRVIEARIAGGVNTTISAGPWVALGAGAVLRMPAIANDTGVEIELRVVAPSSISGTGTNVKLRAERAIGEALGVGLESTRGGVVSGIGDPTALHVVVAGDVAQNSGGADDQVEIPACVVVASGVPTAIAAELRQLAAAASGKARYDLLSFAADGTVTTTSGTEVDQPLAPGDAPALPAGELALAQVAVDDSGVIEDADITQLWSLDVFGLRVVAGLVVEVGSGSAHVSDRLVVFDAPSQISLAASSTSSVWVLRDRSLAVTTDGNPPAGSPRAELLWVITTDGTSVTASVDHRRWLERVETVALAIAGDVAASDTAATALPGHRDAAISPLAGGVAAVEGIGDGTGALDIEVEISEAGGAWFSIGSASIASSDTDLTAEVAWTSYALPRGCRLRVRVTGVPGGATVAPSNLSVVLDLVR